MLELLNILRKIFNKLKHNQNRYNTDDNYKLSTNSWEDIYIKGNELISGEKNDSDEKPKAYKWKNSQRFSLFTFEFRQR